MGSTFMSNSIYMIIYVADVCFALNGQRRVYTGDYDTSTRDFWKYVTRCRGHRANGNAANLCRPHPSWPPRHPHPIWCQTRKLSNQ